MVRVYVHIYSMYTMHELAVHTCQGIQIDMYLCTFVCTLFSKYRLIAETLSMLIVIERNHLSFYELVDAKTYL